MSSYGIVEYFYEHRGHKCGYCKSKSSSYSCGMWGHVLTPEIYDNLIDRGWRRSGEYCYKPIMKKTCCPQYPIKLDVRNFKLSKSHKKVLKKVRKFLASGKSRCTSEKSCSIDEDIDGMGDTVLEEIPAGWKKTEMSLGIDTGEGAGASYNAQMAEVTEMAGSETVQVAVPSQTTPGTVHFPSEYHVEPRKGKGADPNKPKCIKAKELRRQHKLQKLQLKGELSDQYPVQAAKPVRNAPKSLEDFLNEPFPENPAHNLEIVTVRSNPPSPEFEATFTESWKVFESYQISIHKDSKSECDKHRFRRFLVDSPLQHEPNSAYGLGSFHQQYWLDNKLIAVGVIDILPTCVSSVYLYYDPDYSFLSLGTYSALREIAFTRELQKTCPNITRYCMGFYIHSCPKMRYKGNFSPSYLLCPETYTWHPVEKCKPLLDKSKYCRLEQDDCREDGNKVSNLDDVLILYNRKVTTYKRYRELKGDSDRPEVEEYASLVGRKNVKSILLYRSA